MSVEPGKNHEHGSNDGFSVSTGRVAKDGPPNRTIIGRSQRRGTQKGRRARLR